MFEAAPTRSSAPGAWVIRIAMAGCALLLSAAPLLAWTSAGFDLETCVWNATAVVVVDPNGVVLDVWVGEMEACQVVPLALLGIDSEQRYRPLWLVKVGNAFEWREMPPEWTRIVKAERMVLFLKRATGGEDRQQSWASSQISEHGIADPGDHRRDQRPGREPANRAVRAGVPGRVGRAGNGPEID